MARLAHFSIRWLAAACLLLVLGGSYLTPRVDAAMIGRVLVGAEWLVQRAESSAWDPAEISEAERLGREALRAMRPANRTFLSRLLVLRGRLERSAEHDFAEALVAAGYGGSETAEALWLEEVRIVSAALGTAGRAPAKSADQIEAELLRLPTVPLDESDAATRADLEAALGAALMSAAERAAIDAAAARIKALQARIATGTDR